MSEPDRIVEELQRQAAHGRSAVEVATWLWDELGPDPSYFPFARCLFLAFEIPLVAIRDAERWSGLGFGGPVSDEELGRLLSPLVIRTRPVAGAG